MDEWIRFVGPNDALEIAGVKLVGVTVENGRKLLFSLVFLVVVLLLGRLSRAGASWLLRGWENLRVRFWTQQIIHLATAGLVIIGLISIWFDDPGRFATFFGLVSAGLAFALQKTITALAGY